MALFHLQVSSVSRAAGRSATAAAAYRAGSRIRDERTGLVHDYRLRERVVHTEIVLPEGAPEWARDRAKLWNAAEAAERREDSQVAREFEIGLPAEVGPEERRALAVEFAGELVARHGFAADLSVYLPPEQGDPRNHYAQVLVTTRRLEGAGFGEKTRELSELPGSRHEVTRWRERWAALQNARLIRGGRVDHRSLADQGLEREPEIHLGAGATGKERRGEGSDRGDELADIRQRNRGHRE